MILRVQVSHQIDEAEWRRAGFTVVGAEPGKVLILFTDDGQMTAFRERVLAYQRDPPPNQQHPAYSGLMNSIESEGMSSLGPEDRIGPLIGLLLAAGGPDPETDYRLDIELWHLGTKEACDAKLNELRRFVVERGGAMTDYLVGDGQVLSRVRLAGAFVAELLTIPTIATVDLPPRASHSVWEVEHRQLDNAPPLRAPESGAPRICVIDSGLARGHPLLRDAIGETIAAPLTLGDGLDVFGHGTMVAGVALYGDIDAAWRADELIQEVWIDGARVTNEDNEFDDERLISSQMIEAIEYFAELGCRVFNISLGDVRLPYQEGGRPSPWAATLDNLAHRLGVLIIVSAGNYYHHLRNGVAAEECASGYPHYLLGAAARIIEPATGANVLTVGALASSGVPEAAERYPDDVPSRPVARPNQPAPFTRSGFGVRGAVKPELVEVGGNFSYDPRRNMVQTDPGLAMVLLNWQHEQGRLFTLDSGTSLAAPRVANLAARVFAEYPSASANLVRALLVHGADIPEAVTCLPLSDDDQQRLCGYGKPDLDRVLFSTDQRSLLVSEAELPLDWLHVYEVPIPPVFRDAAGERRIAVTVAFTPPVRRRRAEYLGNNMAFRLVRGLSLEEVVRIFRALDPLDQPVPLPEGSDCPLAPGSRRRERGTIQHADWIIRRNRSLQYQEPFYLVIRSERGWQKADDPAQPYAVVVSLEHRSRNIHLYDELRIRTQVTQRARVQV